MKTPGPDLFDFAADREAFANPNLPRSQAKAEILAPIAAPIDDGLFGPRSEQTCKLCGATFIAAPRRPRICNLCRRDPERATRKPDRQKSVRRPSR